MSIIISVIVLFVGIGALVLIHICGVERAFRRSGNGNGNAMDRGSFGSRSMSQGDLENLPCFDFKARVEGSSPVDCAVCLENFKDLALRQTPADTVGFGREKQNTGKLSNSQTGESSWPRRAGCSPRSTNNQEPNTQQLKTTNLFTHHHIPLDLVAGTRSPDWEKPAGINPTMGETNRKKRIQKLAPILRSTTKPYLLPSDWSREEHGCLRTVREVT
ncbi:hypothetical protein RHGRI_022905 [Rhododendron griersonianum]|uniref:RING/U-box superfamily protein n=1 Tax=Rhododendron griersonianum TaxID=479676 RepID=A0AAV6J385_9ERIC|nr:hypothetical protein RHGRI_022905 [Rhododendron griersonianum]